MFVYDLKYHSNSKEIVNFIWANFVWQTRGWYVSSWLCMNFFLQRLLVCLILNWFWLCYKNNKKIRSLLPLTNHSTLCWPFYWIFSLIFIKRRGKTLKEGVICSNKRVASFWKKVKIYHFFDLFWHHYFIFKLIIVYYKITYLETWLKGSNNAFLSYLVELLNVTK